MGSVSTGDKCKVCKKPVNPEFAVEMDGYIHQMCFRKGI